MDPKFRNDQLKRKTRSLVLHKQNQEVNIDKSENKIKRKCKIQNKKIINEKLKLDEMNQIEKMKKCENKIYLRIKI